MEECYAAPYFKKLVNKYAFNELSDDFLSKMKASDILSGVPVPIEEKKLADVYGGSGGISMLDITRACAIVLGADPSFLYSGAYKEFLKRTFGEHAYEVLVNEAHAYYKKGLLTEAACVSRAALEFSEEPRDAIYSYALFTREIYLNARDEHEDLSERELDKLIGAFKAESLSVLEEVTIRFPDFAFPYYYLGYAYLNLGLYTKAYLTWKDFLEKLKDDPASDEAAEEKKEIEEQLLKLESPIEIEEGVRKASAGSYFEAIEILSKYSEGEYSKWWPIHYWLGVSYECTGDAEKAIASFKKGLAVSPSNIDTMNELAAIYELTGDTENEKKYKAKIEVVKKNREEDINAQDAD